MDSPHKLHLYIPASFPWNWKYLWQTPSVFVDPPRFTATCTCQFPGWAFVVAQHIPDVIHCTHTQQATYNAHISPPLHIFPPLGHSFSSHTTTSDTSSEFTAYNQIKMTTPSKDSFAVFKQDGNKCPILHHSELSTKIFHNFITGCLSYITNKEIAADKQMIKVITMLKGYIWEDWVSVHYDELKALSLTNFLQHFKDAFMPTEWETDVCVKLNVLSQTKNQTFHDYSTAMWNVNSLLHGTDSFLNDVKLHTCIKAGMDLTLARCTWQETPSHHPIPALAQCSQRAQHWYSSWTHWTSCWAGSYDEIYVTEISQQPYPVQSLL